MKPWFTGKPWAKSLEALKSAHPYETPAYDIYPLEPEARPTGLGRVGQVEPPLLLLDFVKKIKMDMGVSHVRFCGPPDLLIQKAAVCSGSGGSLLGRFFSCGADVFVSGDLGYHDARTVEDAGKALVDLGHFETEHPVVEDLARRLARAAEKKNLEIKVEAYTRETPVFRTI